MIIDSHHHFWNYQLPDFAWVGDERLERDFLPTELAATLAQAGVDQVISIQARQSDIETRWLLELAKQHPFVAGVVGWVSLIDRNAAARIESIARDKKLCGLRHVLQGERDDDYMLRDDFQRGIAAMRRHDLAYDLLILPRHLPNACSLVDRHPEQVFVLDHLAKPLEGNDRDAWEDDLRSLAERENVYCKLAAGVIEIDSSQARIDLLKPLFDIALEAFGAKRLMFGSNWPLTEVAGGYDFWLRLVQQWARPLSPAERDSIFSATATAAYRLKRTN